MRASGYRDHLLFCFPVVVLFWATLSATCAMADPLRPNIILIMADDMGAEGLGSYGSTIYSTPHLDRMADEGARFDNAYATPLCTPTRVMLMTGQYPNRTGFTNLISKQRKARMPNTLKTFGTYFKEAGYVSAVAGKWQLGRLDEFSNQPVEHGFDEYCLWKWQFKNKKSSRYYNPGIWCNGVSIDGGPDDFGPDIYLHFVLNFIERHRDVPFLIYYPMALVHLPLVRPPSQKALAYSKYPRGIDRRTARYGHMITYMDTMIGEILQKVREVGIEDNTLVIFTADNGSPNEVLSRMGHLVIPGGKGKKTEAGTRVPFIARWPGRIPPGERDQLISLVDVLPTIASIAQIAVGDEVDGLDLSHNLFGTEGEDRDHVFFSFGNDFWIRDKEFRFHNDGSIVYCPVNSNKSRYGFRGNHGPFTKTTKRRFRKLLHIYKDIVPSINIGNSVRGGGRHRRKARVTRSPRAAPLRPSSPPPGAAE